MRTEEAAPEEAMPHAELLAHGSQNGYMPAQGRVYTSGPGVMCTPVISHILTDTAKPSTAELSR